MRGVFSTSWSIYVIHKSKMLTTIRVFPICFHCLIIVNTLHNNTNLSIRLSFVIELSDDWTSWNLRLHYQLCAVLSFKFRSKLFPGSSSFDWKLREWRDSLPRPYLVSKGRRQIDGDFVPILIIRPSRRKKPFSISWENPIYMHFEIGKMIRVVILGFRSLK